jgi:glycerophosphoryl diester phosphodiesterase
MSKIIIKLPLYILHKGYAKNCPENTLDSILDAKRHAAQWVEIDVNVLKDGTPIIFHDDEYNGKKLCDYDNYVDFCNQKFISKGQSYQPPSLMQALRVCCDHQLGVNLDLKESVNGYEQQVIDIIGQFACPMLLSSFYPPILINCTKINSHLKIGILFDTVPTNWKQLVEELNVDSIHVNYQNLTDPLIKALKETQCPLVAYTVNDKNICDELFLKGIDAIITDEIDGL